MFFKKYLKTQTDALHYSVRSFRQLAIHKQPNFT